MFPVIMRLKTGLVGELVITDKIKPLSPESPSVFIVTSILPVLPGSIFEGYLAVTLLSPESTLCNSRLLLPRFLIVKLCLTSVPALILPKSYELDTAIGSGAFSICSFVYEEKLSRIFAAILNDLPCTTVPLTAMSALYSVFPQFLASFVLTSILTPALLPAPIFEG